MGYTQINLPSSTGPAPSLRCGTDAIVYFDEKLGRRCKRCMVICLAAIEDGAEIQEEKDAGWQMLMLREKAIDLYCLMALADEQMDRPQ